jgi:hypothetical protein
MNPMAREPYIPPPPRADQTFGNVEINHVRKIDGRTLRAKKDQEQLNTKVRAGFGDEIDGVRRQLQAQLKRDVPRGEMLEMMLAAFVAAENGVVLKDANAFGGRHGQRPAASDDVFRDTADADGARRPHENAGLVARRCHRGPVGQSQPCHAHGEGRATPQDRSVIARRSE